MDGGVVVGIVETDGGEGLTLFQVVERIVDTVLRLLGVVVGGAPDVLEGATAVEARLGDELDDMVAVVGTNRKADLTRFEAVGRRLVSKRKPTSGWT